MTLTWVESHCHFDFSTFDEDQAHIWSRAEEAGMRAMVIPGVSLETCERQFEVVSRFCGAYGAVGLHPWWIERSAQDGVARLSDQLVEEAVRRGAVAIGECGLDAHIDTPMSLQQAVLEHHIEAAIALDLPLILHVRKAHQPMLSLLKRFKLPRGAVLHAFTGSFAQAQAYIKKGVMLGVGGSITYPRAKKTRHALSHVALDALLLETDAPDMPLMGRQGETNFPYYIPEIIKVLAQLRGEPAEEVALRTTRNATSFFNLLLI